MDLETLQRTYKENDIYGNPVRGIYHYQVIQRMTDDLPPSQPELRGGGIFAARTDVHSPDVVILPQVEQTYGEKAVEAHVLRRIFTTIRILTGYRRTDNRHSW